MENNKTLFFLYLINFICALVEEILSIDVFVGRHVDSKKAFIFKNRARRAIGTNPLFTSF